MDESIAEVILLIGLAVGVDYSLFYLRRERDERRAGRSESAALEAAAATSGRAVLISGFTVMIAMAGMFFSGDKTFMSFAIGTMMVVAVAMIGSLTVLPAVLSWLGDRVDKVRVPFVGRLKRADGESRLWAAILDAGPAPPARLGPRRDGRARRLAIPALSLHTAQSGFDALPKSHEGSTVVQQGACRLPGRSNPGRGRDQGQRVGPAAPGGGRRPEAAGTRLGQGARADLHGHVPGRQGRSRRDPARRRRHRRDIERRARHAADAAPAGDGGQGGRASSTRSRAIRLHRRTGTRR